MKIKLKLTRMEMKGMAAMVVNCCNALRGVDFIAVQYRDALSGLMLKLAGKMPTVRETNRMTLTDIEALAIWEVVGDLVGKMEPLEAAVGLTVLGEIERQSDAKVTLMRGNLAGITGGENTLIRKS